MPALPEIGSGLPEVVLRTAIVYLFFIGATSNGPPKDDHAT